MLLIVMAHAGLVNITHHHGQALRFPSAVAGTVSLTNGSIDSAGTNRHWCLSCCLQSTFVTDDVRQVSITPALNPAPVSPDLFISAPTSSVVSLVLSDRAPPLV